ncbi:hypothetical protein BJ138DRAFT_1118580 [Hygrophoropsis aurantiaca]|uniref:Uncharacterized protein n=1 Tax=Hygrophoropsis aurantiaca TaxID=72124 RepID=A0ACB7ZWQ3_9AGAM|nr:hypothetical protein BJ138DRAFT_1118580 [Hygrophoropsis aurantiaca]
MDAAQPPTDIPSTKEPNTSFDALIDLLASDDPLEDSARGSIDTQKLVLRDPSGKLDFDKIRSMFSRQPHVSPGGLQLTHGKDVSDRVTAINSQQRSEIEQGHIDPTSTQPPKYSDFPHNERPAPQTLPLFHPESNQISTPVPPDVQADHKTRSPSLTSSMVVMDPLMRPLAFDQLNNALSHANDEVRDLRRRFDELQALVSERVPRCTSSTRPDIAKGSSMSSSHASASASIPNTELEQISKQFPQEIETLSETQAKSFLLQILRSFGLPSAVIAQKGSAQDEVDAVPALSTKQQPPRSLEDIQRAINFLVAMDETVWRRGIEPNDNPYLFSEENVTALEKRIVLWEKTVRGSYNLPH